MGTCTSHLPPARLVLASSAPSWPCWSTCTKTHEPRQASESQHDHNERQSGRDSKSGGVALRKHRSEFGRIRAMARETHTRAPDANHGACLLPLQVEASTAAVVRDQELTRACPSMGANGQKPRCQLARERPRSEISGFISQIATRDPNATGGRDPPWRLTCGLDPPRTSHGCDI